MVVLFYIWGWVMSIRALIILILYILVNLKHFITVFKKHTHIHAQSQNSDNSSLWKSSIPASVCLSALSSSRLALFVVARRATKNLPVILTILAVNSHFPFQNSGRERKHSTLPRVPRRNPQFHSIGSQVHAWIYHLGRKRCGMLSLAWSGSCPHPWIWGVSGWVNNIQTTRTRRDGCFPRGKPRCC